MARTRRFEKVVRRGDDASSVRTAASSWRVHGAARAQAFALITDLGESRCARMRSPSRPRRRVAAPSRCHHATASSSQVCALEHTQLPRGVLLLADSASCSVTFAPIRSSPRTPPSGDPGDTALPSCPPSRRRTRKDARTSPSVTSTRLPPSSFSSPPRHPLA